MFIVSLLQSGVFAIFKRKAEKVEAEVKEIMDELHVIGLSVAVVNKGEIVYQNHLVINLLIHLIVPRKRCCAMNIF